MRLSKYLIILAATVILAAAASGCTHRPVKNRYGSGVGVVCFGDSLTFGYGAERGEDYPTVLAGLVGVPVVNAGMDGDTSNKGLCRLEADVLARNPRLVIIEFGGNDFLNQVSREQTAENLRQMIRRIQAHGAMVALVDISAGLLMREYAPVLERLAIEEKALFIPAVFRGIITNPSLKSDFVHPNAQGYRIVAERIARAVRPYVTSIRKRY